MLVCALQNIAASGKLKMETGQSRMRMARPSALSHQLFLFRRKPQRGKSNRIAAFQNLLSRDKNKLPTPTYLINLRLSFNRINLSPAIRKKNILLSISFLQ